MFLLPIDHNWLSWLIFFISFLYFLPSLNTCNTSSNPHYQLITCFPSLLKNWRQSEKKKKSLNSSNHIYPGFRGWAYEDSEVSWLLWINTSGSSLSLVPIVWPVSCSPSLTQGQYSCSSLISLLHQHFPLIILISMQVCLSVYDF